MSELRSFTKNFNRLSNFENFFQAIPQGEHSVHTLCTHRHKLTRLWEAFRDSYVDLLENTEDTKISAKDA